MWALVTLCSRHCTNCITGSIITLGYINASKAYGGSDRESIDVLRANIPASFRSQDRAVSIYDYRDLTLRVPGINKANAVAVAGSIAKTGYITNKSLSASVALLTTSSAHSLTVGETIAVFNVDDTFNGTYVVKTGSTGTSLYYDLPAANVSSASVSSSASYINAQVKVYAATAQSTYDSTVSSVPLSTTYRDAVYSYLSTRTMIGVNTVVMPSITTVPISISLTLNVLPNYVQANVVADVKSAISDLFTFDSVSFGQTLTLGDLYRTVLDVTGVDYVTVDQYTSTNGATTIDTVGLTPVVKGVKADTDKLLVLNQTNVTASGGITVA